MKGERIGIDENAPVLCSVKASKEDLLVRTTYMMEG